MYRQKHKRRHAVILRSTLTERPNMPAKAKSTGHISAASKKQLLQIKQSIEGLSQSARAERADFLAYLLEMAATEAGDIISGKSASGSREVDRDEPRRMTM
jgi:hypothetical protein